MDLSRVRRGAHHGGDVQTRAGRPVAETRNAVHDRSAESRFLPRTIELRPSSRSDDATTALGLASRPQAARTASSGLPSTQVTTAHRTTRTTGGRPRGSMPRSHRPTRHTSALRPTLPPTPGRGLGVEVAQSMPRSSTHPDHAASPPLSLCRLEMAPSIQYSFCTARCGA